MSWWNSYRAVYGAELRAGALCLVDHGWPVAPGTWWQGGGWRGLAGELARSPGWDPVPSVVGGVAAASCDPAQVARWWSRSPFSVLVATGTALDVIEVPAWMGRRVASTLRSVGVVAPLVATPVGRWWFPVGAGASARPELAARTEIVLHGSGSWVMAPPSASEGGLVHWRVNPSVCGWRLPESLLVQSAVAEAIRWRATEGDDWLVPQRPAGVGSGVRS